MTTTQRRQEVVVVLEEAVKAGARRAKACELAGISERTLRRWKPAGTDRVQPDRRPQAQRPAPKNRLTPHERQQLLDVCNQPEFASLPPSQIVPKLADQGLYLASESTFYRVLKAAGQLHHRGRTQKRRPCGGPRTHLAQGPNQVWMWDITFLPALVRGQFYFLYLVEDLYSRKIVAWEVHEREAGDLAAALIQQALWREKCLSQRPVLHADNGSAMKSQTLRVKLQDLGIAPSYSRPGVSDDNAFIESVFRTLKYCPTWPRRGFSSLEEARQWTQRFVSWYNDEHQHSKLRFVTPAQRHRREDEAVLAGRHHLYLNAREKHPERWSGQTRNWSPVGAVVLNPVNSPDLAESAA